MLKLYRRHSPNCQHYGKRRNAKGTTGCKCPMWIQGSLGGEWVKESMHTTSWQEANRRVHEWEASGQIGVSKTEVPNLKDAMAKYVTYQEGHNKPESIKKLKLGLANFQAFCSTRSISFLRHLNMELLTDYRTHLLSRLSASTVRIRFTYTKSFLRFCQDSGWIQVNPAARVKPPAVEKRMVETFTEAEINSMLDAANRFRTQVIHGAGNRKRIRAMILLLRYSGMRISDCSVLARKRLDGNLLTLRTIKTGTDISIPIPDVCVEALKESVSENPDYFFWNGKCKETSAVKTWERTFERVFEMANIPEQKRFIHNFRHTFATDLLGNGMSLEDVATLLGNTPKIVGEHYDHLVPSRLQMLKDKVSVIWK